MIGFSRLLPKFREGWRRAWAEPFDCAQGRLRVEGGEFGRSPERESSE